MTGAFAILHTIPYLHRLIPLAMRFNTTTKKDSMNGTKGGNATNLSYRIQNILFWHDIGRGRSLIKQKKDVKEFMIILFELHC